MTTPDLDALLARADYWLDHVADSVSLETSIDIDLVRDLAAAIRILRNERDAERARADRNAELIGKHDPTGEDHLRDAMEAAERYDTALDVIRDLADDEPCSFDHHGYCQTHCWLQDGECPVARARAVLAAAETRRSKP